MNLMKKTDIAYRNMLARCNSKNRHNYSAYGGKGIRVMWKTLAEFREDMLPSLEQAIVDHPGEIVSIDRIDSNGHYCADNCRWIPIRQNSSRAHKGKPKSQAHREAMSRERKGKPQTPARAAQLAKTHENARRPVIRIDADGNTKIYPSIKDAAEDVGRPNQNIQEVCSGSNPRRKTVGGYRWQYA